MQVVRRALQVLRVLSDHQDGLTLQDLSRELSSPPATMHRLLAVLEDERFVVRSATTKRYSLGADAFLLALTAKHVAEVAREELAALSRSNGETAFVSELVGDRAVCTALVEGSRPLRLFVRVGQELPLHAAASSRAIIAFLDQEYVAEVLRRSDLVRFTDETPGTVDETLAHLLVVRSQGFDLCEEELDPNVWAVGAPIRDHIGNVVASVTVAGPVERIDAVTRRKVIGDVRAAADAISRQIGFRDKAAQAAQGGGT